MTGLESLGGRHLQFQIGAMFATSSAVGTCSPHALSVMRPGLMFLELAACRRSPGFRANSLDPQGSWTLAFSLVQGVVTRNFVSRGMQGTDR